MPKTIKYNGRSFKFFTQAEVDGSNKSPDTFIEVPPEVVTSHGLTGPLFYYVGGNIAKPQIPPRNLNWASRGRWVHLAKIAFEKYFLRKVKKGVSEPVYEKVILEFIGLKKLRES